jgi:SAM-dependent methyltransferase
VSDPRPLENPLAGAPARTASADTRIRDGAVYWDDVGRVSRPADSWETLWRRHSDAVNSAWLAPHLAEAAFTRILKTDLFDEALSEGLFPLLATRSRSVIGIDVAQSTARGASARHPDLRAAGGDVRCLPFATGAFDCVVSNSTLDHFPSTGDIAAGLSELHRVLRPQGLLLLTLDNPSNPIVAIRNALPFPLLHALGVLPYRVGVTCSAAELQRLARQAGFEVRDTGVILHCPRVLAVAAMRLLARSGSVTAQQRLLDLLTAFERLARWPTRFITGHFVAIVARRG